MKRKLKFYFYQSVIAIVILFASGTSKLYSQSLQDDSLRANYLVNFVDFIRWDEVKDDKTVVGVIGAPMLLTELEGVATKRRAKGRNITIVEVKVGDSIENIDVLYFGSGQKNNWEPLIDAAMKNCVVTVGEEDGFLDTGGLIEFVVRRNRLRFSLNLEVAGQYRVGLSSKLSQLSVN